MKPMTYGLLGVALLLGGIGRANADVVYLGQDPSFHYQYNPTDGLLGGNATRFAADGNSNPTVGVIADGSFGENVLGMLQSQGFTHLTAIAPGSLASTDLSRFQSLYFGPTSLYASISDYAASAGRIQSYVNAGGGLVVEPEVFASNSWSRVPGAGSIGSSGSYNVALDQVTITDPNSAVMAGLTSADLSNWGYSVHTDFATPGAAGFVTLATDANGKAVDIALSTTTVPVPPGFVLFGLGTIGMAIGRWRRGKNSVRYV